MDNKILFISRSGVLFQRDAFFFCFFFFLVQVRLEALRNCDFYTSELLRVDVEAAGELLSECGGGAR